VDQPRDDKSVERAAREIVREHSPFGKESGALPIGFGKAVLHVERALRSFLREFAMW